MRDGWDDEYLLSFDYGSCLAPAAGAGGLAEGALSSCAAAAAAWESVERLRREEDTCFLHLPYRREEMGRIEEFADRAQGRFDDVVLAGIGGSCLGPQAVFDALREERRYPCGPAVPGHPRLWFLDTVDPGYTRAVLDPLEVSRTLFLAVSKSGNTVETAAHLAVIRALIRERLGEKALAGHLAVVTDPEAGPLAELARSEGLTSFPIPPGVGGRFSVLSPVGLLPLALAGIDVRSLLGGATMADARSQGADPARNPALLLACLLHLLHRDRGVTQAVMMPYAPALSAAGDWFRQLLAESLGKLTREGRPEGMTPMTAVGTTDQHSLLQLLMEGPRDKVVIFIRLEDHGEELAIPADPGLPAFAWVAGRGYGELLNAAQTATAAALAAAGRPSLAISLPALTPYALGQLIWHLEVSVAALGALWEVDPFDQPGVEEGKRNLAALMGKPGTEERACRLQELASRPRRVVR
jgi:glucose-6-phosphate isomerase